jgi:N6-adenosine-specific RNA methylase IME4
MSLQEIKDLPVPQLCEKDCVLFLWTTYPMLREALQVIEAWGFKYKSGKGYFFGLGRWTRGNTEPCLLAVKGKPSRKNNGVSQLIEWPIGVHSEKPAVTRDKIKALMGGIW